MQTKLHLYIKQKRKNQNSHLNIDDRHTIDNWALMEYLMFLLIKVSLKSKYKTGVQIGVMWMCKIVNRIPFNVGFL